jgi:hypothetical protein
MTMMSLSRPGAPPGRCARSSRLRSAAHSGKARVLVRFPFCWRVRPRCSSHESHRFEDDVDFAVSRYRYWVSVHDSARNTGRQLAVAQRVFDAAMAQGLAGDALLRRPGPRGCLPVRSARIFGPAGPGAAPDDRHV